MWNILEGTRILDLSRVFAGPAATQILGDLGAEVIKVEEPEVGDEARGFGMTQEMVASGITVSPSFLALNRNKKSMAINLASASGQELVRKLIAGCDVVVNNFRPGTMERYGLGYESLRGQRPDLIFCQFSAYGDQGPLTMIGANDLALQAHSGLMSITGEPDRPPVRCGTSLVDLHASLALVVAIMAALMHRQKTGEGQIVETSLLQSSAHLMNYFYGEYWATGVIRKPMGTANHLSVPNQVFPAQDGQVVIIAPGNEMWLRCAQALDAEKLDRPEWRGLLDRQKYRAELVQAVSEVTLTMSCDDIIRRLGPVKVNVAKVNHIGEAADHPQLAAADALTSFEMNGQPLKAVKSPFNLKGTPGRPDNRPPELAEHTDDICRALGLTDEELAAFRSAGAFAAPKR
ncbi:MAG: CoA transferase [Ottowia sp.]|uniref:CaiB/BaiF CoA transferase family protein n=1 Tax=unclassified Ottowia TaxID=2645081 RepID=UPI003C2EF500